MQDGADQLRDWMDRRGFNATETAVYFGWDLTFVSKLLNRHRSPGLTNAIKIERQTGIPAEAWVSSELDTSDEALAGHPRKRLQTQRQP